MKNFLFYKSQIDYYTQFSRSTFFPCPQLRNLGKREMQSDIQLLIK